MYLQIKTIQDALKIAEQAEEENLNGIYPAALRILANEIKGLYKKIDMPSPEPVQYVGVYTLTWQEVHSGMQPEVGFVEVADLMYE